MMEKIMILLICFFSSASFALTMKDLQDLTPHPHGCQQAPPTTDPSFCGGFKSSANCHCLDSGMDDSVCSDMNRLYDAMIAYFNHSLESACDFQQYQEGGVPKQVCIDDWNCYRKGGVNSNGGLCSSMGSAC
jgi:hypothetical protein